MARRPRIILEGQPHHIVQRGHNREPVFFEGDDYGAYLLALEHASDRYGCEVHAYCLMTNHIHLLVTPRAGNQGLSRMMQMVGRVYVRGINSKYRRSGTLWEDRFKVSLVDAENYFLACMRYIELNPVRARMVRKPKNYEWSSYHRNALGESTSIIKEHDIYTALATTARVRQSVYRKLFESISDRSDFIEISNAEKGGWVLGRDDFKEKIERMTGQKVMPTPRGGDRKSRKFKKHH